MKSARNAAVIGLMATVLTGCGTQGQAVKPDKTGYLPTGTQVVGSKATTVVAEKIDPSEARGLAVVGTDFAVKQVQNLGYFKEVIDRPELERRIVAQKLQDKIPSLNDRIGLNNAARYYGKFLWIHNEIEKRDGTRYVKLIATDPITLRDVFVAELGLVNPMLTWSGYNDQNTWYPLYNSMIDWLKIN